VARALAARHLLTDHSPEGLKRAAAARAVEHVRSATIVGLGTGSTVRPLLELLGERLGAGVLHDVTGVPTSEDTAAKCRALGIPLITLDEAPQLDLCIDGADEIGPGLSLIKGLGGALLREKIVALAARRFIIIADDSKRVRKLGTRAPLPVEVIPFGWTTHSDFFRKLGAEPVLRRTADGKPYLTDGGHFIVDCRFAKGMADPAAVARALDKRPGIVDHGLFLRMADLACIAGPSGVREIRA
jgi:ribose 5-phosphate isomerase A